MREEYNEYDDARYDDEYGYDEQPVDNKAVRGYRIVIIILAVILVALSVVYFNMHREQQAEYVLLEQDRTRIQGDLDSLIVSFDDLKVKNDSMTANLEEANKLMDQLKNERRLNYAKIRAYEKELGTLKTIMKSYLRQIDSLNTVNQKLTKENVSYKKQISTAQLRAEMAEERAEELNNKVRVGSVIRARAIGITPLNAKSKEVTLILDGVAIDSPTDQQDSAIYSSGVELTVVLVGENSLSDGTSNENKGVITVKNGSLTFDGIGTLNINTSSASNYN